MSCQLYLLEGIARTIKIRYIYSYITCILTDEDQTCRKTLLSEEAKDKVISL